MCGLEDPELCGLLTDIEGLEYPTKLATAQILHVLADAKPFYGLKATNMWHYFSWICDARLA